MEGEIFVSIVICTKNRARHLDELALDSISKLNYSNFEVVVIDDASIDNTKEIVEKYKNKIKNLKYVRNEKSKGLCFVRNLGVKNSNGQIIAFIDDDAVADKNWLKELVKPYLENKNVAVVGGRIFVKETNRIHNRKKQIYGSNMSFRKEVFNKFLFDENLKYSNYHDEIDLIARIKNHGFGVICNEKAVVRHFLAPTVRREKAHIGRKLNFIYLTAKNFNLRLVEYCKIVLTTLLFGPKAKKILKIKKRNINEQLIDEIDGLRGTLSLKYRRFWIKLPYAFFILLFVIPIKAKIKHKIEEDLFKNG